jgi:hypothetical protein
VKQRNLKESVSEKQSTAYDAADSVGKLLLDLELATLNCDKKVHSRRTKLRYINQLQLNRSYDSTANAIVTRDSFNLLCDTPFTALGGDINEFISDVCF